MRLARGAFLSVVMVACVMVAMLGDGVVAQQSEQCKVKPGSGGGYVSCSFPGVETVICLFDPNTGQGTCDFGAGDVRSCTFTVDPSNPSSGTVTCQEAPPPDGGGDGGGDRGPPNKDGSKEGKESPSGPEISQEFEQEAESGDVDQSFEVSGSGDNSNQCVGGSGVTNTGNAQNQTGVLQFVVDADDFKFDEDEATLTVTDRQLTTCDQQVNQAASASG